jgi:HK97 gp10 family phage protein
MITVHIVLLLMALICFLLAAIKVQTPRVNLIALGMGEARAQLKVLLMKPALVLRDEARDLAPEGATGKLKQSIRVTKGPQDKRGVLVYVDTSKNPAYYARFVERGTSKMAAKPFFRFVLQATRPLIANLIAEDLKPVIEGMATKLGWHPCTAT